MQADPYDQMKQTDGAFVTFAWLGSCLYLFAVDGSHGGLFSLKFAAFAFVGMFVAATVLGMLFHYLKRVLTKLIAPSVMPSRGTAVLIQGLGVVLMVLEVVVVFLVAQWLYRSIWPATAA